MAKPIAMDIAAFREAATLGKLNLSREYRVTGWYSNETSPDGPNVPPNTTYEVQRWTTPFFNARTRGHRDTNNYGRTVLTPGLDSARNLTGMTIGPNAEFLGHLVLVNARIPLLDQPVVGNLSLDSVEMQRLGPHCQVKGNIILDTSLVESLEASCDGTLVIQQTESIPLTIHPDCRFRDGVSPHCMREVFRRRGITQPYQQWLVDMHDAMSDSYPDRAAALLEQVPPLKEKLMLDWTSIQPPAWRGSPYTQSKWQPVLLKLLPHTATIPTPAWDMAHVPPDLIAPCITHGLLLNQEAYSRHLNYGQYVCSTSCYAPVGKWLSVLHPDHQEEVAKVLPKDKPEIWKHSTRQLDLVLAEHLDWPGQGIAHLPLLRANDPQVFRDKIKDLPGTYKDLVTRGHSIIAQQLMGPGPYQPISTIVDGSKHPKLVNRLIRTDRHADLEIVLPDRAQRAESVFRLVQNPVVRLETRQKAMGYLVAGNYLSREQQATALVGIATLPNETPPSRLWALERLVQDELQPLTQSLAHLQAIPQHPRTDSFTVWEQLHQRILQKQASRTHLTNTANEQEMDSSLDLV